MQGIVHSTNQSATGGNPVQRSTGRLAAKGGEQTGSTIPMPIFTRRPSTMNFSLLRKYHRIRWMISKYCKSRSFIWTNSPTLSTFFMLEDKIQNPGNFLFWFSLGGYVMDQRSGDGRFGGWIKVIAIYSGYWFPHFWDAGREDCFFFEQYHPEFLLQEEVSLEEQKAQKEDRFLRGREIAYMIYDCYRVTGAHDIVLDYAHLFSVTLHNDSIQEFDTRWDGVLFAVKNSIRWYSGKFVQNENTWVWSTQNRIRNVKHGNSSEDVEAWLSKVENDGEEKYRSETSIAKFWRQAWDDWDRSSGFESQGIKWYWKETRSLLPVESKRTGVRGETNAVSGTRVTIVENRHRKPLHPLSHQLQKHEVEVRREKETSEAEASLRSSNDSRENTC